MDPLQATSNQMRASFHSIECPSCGAGKTSGQTMCRSCFSGLPPKSKRDLYMRFGNGYEGAWREAMRALGVTNAKMQGERVASPGTTPPSVR